MDTVPLASHYPVTLTFPPPLPPPSPLSHFLHSLLSLPPLALSAVRQDTLLVVVCATYACIAPLSLVAGLCYFAGAAFVYKHQMLYVYEPIFETGGKWWPKVVKAL